MEKLFLNTLYTGITSSFKKIMTSYNEGIQSKNVNYEEVK
jgi:predicted GIY-YIG superfamily endonuclease